jgi:hypothetical protein
LEDWVVWPKNNNLDEEQTEQKAESRLGQVKRSLLIERFVRQSIRMSSSAGCRVVVPDSDISPQWKHAKVPPCLPSILKCKKRWPETDGDSEHANAKQSGDLQMPDFMDKQHHKGANAQLQPNHRADLTCNRLPWTLFLADNLMETQRECMWWLVAYESKS